MVGLVTCRCAAAWPGGMSSKAACVDMRDNCARPHIRVKSISNGGGMRTNSGPLAEVSDLAVSRRVCSKRFNYMSGWRRDRARGLSWGYPSLGRHRGSQRVPCLRRNGSSPFVSFAVLFGGSARTAPVLHAASTTFSRTTTGNCRQTTDASSTGRGGWPLRRPRSA